MKGFKEYLSETETDKVKQFQKQISDMMKKKYWFSVGYFKDGSDIYLYDEIVTKVDKIKRKELNVYDSFEDFKADTFKK